MFLLRLSNNDISCLVLRIRIKIVSIRIQLLLKYFLTNIWIFLNFKNCKKLSQYLNFCNKIQIFLTNAFLMRIFYIYQSSNPAKLFGSGQIRIHNADHTRWHTFLGTILIEIRILSWDISDNFNNAFLLECKDTG